MMNPIPVGIVGASGYSGETLVSLLSRHPGASLQVVTSRQWAGQAVAEVMPTLRGRTGGLLFTTSEPAELAAREEVSVWFLALPHGVAAQFAKPLLEAGRRVIDLSADFRLSSTERYEEFYGAPHPAPLLLTQARYVLPELSPLEEWRDARLIACPGCYPTSVQIPLAPVLAAGLASSERIVINSMSGVSGAGKQAREYYSFSERSENLTAYGFPKHRHAGEIEDQLTRYANRPVIVQFNPHLVPMRRGILSTITATMETGAGAESVREAWRQAYSKRPFISILPPGQYPETGAVAHTNRADLAVFEDRRTGNCLLLCAIDNLVKGAAGQAVQIFNLLYDFPESTALY